MTESAGDFPLLSTGTFSVRRRGRFVVAELHHPHLVVSSSYVNGGMNAELRYLANHQCSEGRKDILRHDVISGMGQEAYHRSVAEELSIAAEDLALMSTAAHMQMTAVETSSYEEIQVWALATAGVQGNAGRAGDPATWHEAVPTAAASHKDGLAQTNNEKPGTINLMLFFNWPLSKAALTRAVVTMTEAKTAAIQDLAVGSLYSEGLATGTGTDQFILASPLTEEVPKNWTGKHAKLGEMIGTSVIRAVKESLRFQNGLEPSLTRSLLHALRRFRFTEETFRKGMKSFLPEPDFVLFSNNFESLIYETQVSASAYALAAIRDRSRSGAFPQNALGEIFLNQLALMSAAVSCRSEDYVVYRRAILDGIKTHRLASLDSIGEGEGWTEIVTLALAVGWQAKWKLR